MAEIDRNAMNFDQRISELRNYAQTLQSQDARDIVLGTVGLLQTAWNVERHTDAPTTGQRTPEARSTR